MKYPKENSHADKRIEFLLEIAQAVNHPNLMWITSDEAKLIAASRLGMANLLLRLAILLDGGLKPGKR